MKDRSQARCEKEISFLTVLSNRKTLRGKYVEIFENYGKVYKVFFKSPDGKKELAIRNLTADIESDGGESSLKKEINEYLQFLYAQAKMDFPEWLSVNGLKADEDNPVYSLKEIHREWKSMKSLFGRFRIAAAVGFFSSNKPFEARQHEIVLLKVE